MNKIINGNVDNIPPPPPPPPSHPPPVVHDDVDGHPLPPPPPPPETSPFVNLDDSGGQPVIAYDTQSELFEHGSSTAGTDNWPAPPLMLELPAVEQSVAHIEYKPIMSPVRTPPEFNKAVTKEPEDDVRYKGYCSDSEDKKLDNNSNLETKTTVSNSYTNAELNRQNIDAIKRKKVGVETKVVVVDFKGKSKDKQDTNASGLSNEHDLSLHDSIPVNNRTVVSIPLNTPRTERNRHSFHPVPDHTPVLSSFGSANSSTLPRRTKSELIRRPDYDNMQQLDTKPIEVISDKKQSENKSFIENVTVNKVVNGSASSQERTADIKAIRRIHTSPTLEESPLMKRNSNLTVAKRVFFQLPTTHKDSDVEDTASSKDTTPSPGKMSPSPELKSPNPDKMSPSPDNKSPSPTRKLPSPKLIINGGDSESDPQIKVKNDLQNDGQSSPIQKETSPNKAPIQSIKPPLLRVLTPAEQQARMNSPAARPKSLNKSQSRRGSRLSRTSTTDCQQSVNQSSTTCGSAQSLPLRPARISHLMQKAHHPSPKYSRRADGANAESDDSYFSDSDFDDDDYSEVQHLDDDGISQTSDFTSYSDETMPRSPADRDRCYEVLLELLKTERAYMDRLHFLCRVVLLNVRILTKVQDSFVIPGEALASIFNTVEEIFNLHTATILPKLEDRVENWRTAPRFGDLMKELLAPLSIYTQYVEQFNNAMTAMTMWTERCPIFNRLVVEVEKTPECRRLKVKQHMLEVVQRIPKYLFLLKEYSSHLPQDSTDKEDTHKALSDLTEFVQNLEQAMGQDGRMKQLKSVQQRLDAGSLKIYSPLREVIKEAKIKSISPKSVKKLDRYLFLMNDVLLICTTQTLAGKHKLKYTLEVDGLQVYDGDNLVIPFTFYIQNKTKAIEFHCNSQEEKNDWMATIQGTINTSTETKLMQQPVSHGNKSIKDEDVGKVKPKNVKPVGKPVCSICRASMKRPNFCKACGVLVCSKCSTQKVKLEYDNARKSKVCDECYILIIHRDLKTDLSEIQNVRPSDPCRLAGYLQLNINKSQTWKKRWLTIHDNGVLYSFKNFKDQTLLGCLQLKRYFALATMKGDDIFKPNTLKLYNARRTYYLQADNTDAMSRWLDALAQFTGNRT